MVEFDMLDLFTDQYTRTQRGMAVVGFFPSLFTIPIYREVSPLFFASSTRKHILGKVNEE